MKKFAALALAALATASSAQAAVLTFGTSSTVAPTANPVIAATPGSTVTLYVWGTRSATSGSVNGIGLNIQGVQSGTSTVVPLTGVNFAFNNPDGVNSDGDPVKRWDAVVDPSYNINGAAAFDARAFVVGTSPTSSVGATPRMLGTLTFTATQGVDLYLGVSPFTFSESSASWDGKTQFGFGDAPIASTGAASYNTYSALSDAVVSVPEPTTLSLLGLGALGLIARRRQA